jgi:hypothetical protein
MALHWLFTGSSWALCWLYTCSIFLLVLHWPCLFAVSASGSHYSIGLHARAFLRSSGMVLLVALFWLFPSPALAMPWNLVLLGASLPLCWLFISAGFSLALLWYCSGSVPWLDLYWRCASLLLLLASS